MASAVQMGQAGDVGLPIRWYPNADQSAQPFSLSGATVVMRVAKYPGGAPASLTCVVASDGSFAERETTATDFPAGGRYLVQFVASFGDGSIRRSAAIQAEVGESL
jgi:hypothetical protein